MRQVAARVTRGGFHPDAHRAALHSAVMYGLVVTRIGGAVAAIDFCSWHGHSFSSFGYLLAPCCAPTCWRQFNPASGARLGKAVCDQALHLFCGHLPARRQGTGCIRQFGLGIAGIRRRVRFVDRRLMASSGLCGLACLGFGRSGFGLFFGSFGFVGQLLLMFGLLLHAILSALRPILSVLLLSLHMLRLGCGMFRLALRAIGCMLSEPLGVLFGDGRIFGLWRFARSFTLPCCFTLALLTFVQDAAGDQRVRVRHGLLCGLALLGRLRGRSLAPALCKGGGAGFV